MKHSHRKAPFYDLNNVILEDARMNRNQERVLAIAVLLPLCRDVYAVMEYGDHDGIAQIDSFVEEVKATPGLLRQGEDLVRVLVKVTECVQYDEPTSRSRQS